MKLTNSEISDILSSKGFSCSNIEDYKNLDTVLNLTCKNGHQLQASIKTVRNAHFKCPICDGNASISEKVGNIAPPPKCGERIVAIDNATEKVGISVFDNKKLVFYHLFVIEGDTITRLLKNRKMIEDVVIKQWEPDLIVFEDIQYQNNIQTFKTLAMLLGNSLVSSRAANLKYETVLSKTWRSHFMINGKTRVVQKKEAIDKVKSMYNIDVNDDIAEAILLGKYAVDCLRIIELKKLF